MRTEDLRAYLTLLSHGGPIGVREAQRVLGYRSPGRAQRVLERLEREGLAQRRVDGKYELSKNLPPLLASYIVIRGTVLPRTAVYTVFTTTLFLLYVTLAGPPLYLILVLTALTIPYWLETLTLLAALRRMKRGGLNIAGRSIVK